MVSYASFESGQAQELDDLGLPWKAGKDTKIFSKVAFKRSRSGLKQSNCLPIQLVIYSYNSTENVFPCWKDSDGFWRWTKRVFCIHDEGEHMLKEKHKNLVKVRHEKNNLKDQRDWHTCRVKKAKNEEKLLGWFRSCTTNQVSRRRAGAPSSHLP